MDNTISQACWFSLQEPVDETGDFREFGHVFDWPGFEPLVDQLHSFDCDSLVILAQMHRQNSGSFSDAVHQYLHHEFSEPCRCQVQMQQVSIILYEPA